VTLDVWMQVLRYVLIGLGGYLAKRGVIPDDQVAGVVDQIINAVGPLMLAGGAIWGVWVKWRTKAVPAATAARIDVPTVNPVTGAVQR
jgi:hypothetical protein